MTIDVYVLLGTNLGDKLINLELARRHIIESVGKINKLSKIYETEAWGKEDQPTFYNQVLLINTQLSSVELLKKVLDIELIIGRVRHEKWGARLIDIDLLYYGNSIINTSDLIVPHPEMHKRRFTLAPLAEIAPDHIHPIFERSAEDLLDSCNDSLTVRPL